MTTLFDQINKEVEEMNKEKEMKKNDTAELQAILPEVEHNPDLIEAKPKKRGRPPKVDTDIFVEMWTKATENSSLKEVAASLGISPASCSVKASNLRKAGYDLPQFVRGRKMLERDPMGTPIHPEKTE